MPQFMLQQEAPVSAEQLRQQIQQSVREAQIAASRARADQAAAQGGGGNGPLVIRVPDPGNPGIPTTQVAFDPEHMIPPQVEPIAISFFVMIAAIIIGLPVMRAWARRIDRGTSAPSVPPEVRDQLRHLSQSVDAIAIEVERISEGQRFAARLLSERSTEKQSG